MGKLEKDIEREGCAYAEGRGLEHRKLKWQCRRGAPDRIFWGDGVPIFFIEVKKPGETPRRDQCREINSLRRSGTRVYVCDSVQHITLAISAEIARANAG